VGQVVKVRVLEVNEKLKRISLSMKSPEKTNSDRTPQKLSNRREQKPPTLDDLKAKFGRKS
jgi:uncharacterized protein